ncbi:MAG: DoxX family protein [Muribaculaceae bacterium]|nr:DoxX family protein [Muribaculaceae bacterium]
MASNRLAQIPEPCRTAALWILRVFVGAVFIISGWAKCIDLHGFCLKIGEYLTAMGVNLPPELILIGATGLATLEFVTGVMLATGCLRRMAVWTAAAFMAVMLPLTLWIAIADPVSDCGCFGDLLLLSNNATFIKNVFITAGVALLWIYNRKRPGLFPAPVQWLVIVLSWAYPLYIGYAGYQTQPLVDFRPFRVGTELFAESDEEAGKYVYTRDGEERSFGLDELPDSTWTFVSAEESMKETASLTVYSADGEDVTEEFAELLAESPRTLLLVVSDPETQFMTRAHYLQELKEFLEGGDVQMYALVGASGASFDRWRRLTRPNFPSYSAEDTALKMLVRGAAGVVYLHEGQIMWKSTLGALSADLPYSESDAAELMDSFEPIDSGGPIMWLSVIYLAGMLAVYLLGQSPKMLGRLKQLSVRAKKFAKVEEKP